ncbi:MAG TPA: hypothetical protein PKA33_02775 [Amaricoccus sp.]|uniref:hypothetical protein n=1 Tax=Amaricoccus sp. TaxID=1872485 RepID=UPI002D1010FC|nr:hypothetical protein [Amaricoccus sp.]HMQ91894.1 hypothetical protein [Amaricoccus sp.]HMR51282.1 hypothetical protein [Amaricoccus sp.]HMR59533.1 hypothetical protein [Amaricoccus sp.]HMT98274.1 hypothetical protein [Amaricoccus sp.]
MTDSVIRNEYGEVVYFQHPAPPALESAAPLATPQQVAEWYLRSMRGELGLSGTRLADDGVVPESAVAEPIMEFQSEKDVAGTKVVVYKQTILGLDVFDARLGMNIDEESLSLESLQSSMHGSVVIENPSARVDSDKNRPVSKAALKKMLGFELPDMENARIERQVVYRYEPDQREEPHEHEGCIGGPGAEIPHLPKPKLPGLEKAKHYIADEVLFQAAMAKGQGQVNWRALVEPESGEVLYLRALVACATGLVFDRDPQTQTGAAVNAASTNAVLNPFRTSKTMPGLTAATPQPLAGNFVRIAETQAPVQVAPTVPTPAGAFNFDAQTEQFTATCTYYNCDRLFRTMQDFGFNVSSYFGGTTFPVPVDFRALGDAVNAQAPGNASGNGLLELRFGKMMPGQVIGIGTSNRVAWHEFGHALLWDHVNSPNFGFAHSAGDSLAAILNDPGSNAADRFQTFPWVAAGVGIDRRHDRAIGAGWAWFGPNWNTQYGGEQVLSTTLFRFYRAIGGDAVGIATRRRASDTAAYLIFKAIGLMTSTTAFPEVFVGHLQNADLGTSSFQGIPGGALHKVVRWAFEKQGLFQPGAAPGQPQTVNTEGNPPDVDVYIDDGRAGEYQYQANHWSCQDMWVRRAPDGGAIHQNPLVGLTNYMYVRVKNRGMQTAQNVRVDAYHALPGSGLSFPDDWAPMTTATLPASGPLASGGGTVIGPFAFVPTVVGHECLLAIAHADGDPGNDTTITGTIPEHRLVPFDNNIGQRNVSPVLPTLKDILKLLREHIVWIRNPFRKPVVARLEIELPRFLRNLGWQLHVKSEGGQKFELGPRDRRKVLLVVEPGEDIDAELAKKSIARGDDEIAIRTYLDGELAGGMSYKLTWRVDEETKPGRDPTRDKPQTDGPVIVRRPTIEEILRILRGGIATGEGRTIRTVRLEFDFDDGEGS